MPTSIPVVDRTGPMLPEFEDNISALIHQFGDAKSFDDLRQLLERACRVLGFDTYLFTIAFLPISSRRKCVFLSSYPSDWNERYRARRYYEFDPVMEHCRSRTTPLPWDRIAMPSRIEREAFLSFVGEARAAGLLSGVSFPLHGANGEWGLLSFNSARETSEVARIVTNALASGKLISVYAQEAARRIGLANEDVPTEQILTLRERECITWTYEGKTSWEISKILNISERTVVFHIRNTMLKLNARNRIQAAARAMYTLSTDPAILLSEAPLSTGSNHARLASTALPSEA